MDHGVEVKDRMPNTSSIGSDSRRDGGNTALRESTPIVQVNEEVVTLAGWPTDVVRIDYPRPSISVLLQHQQNRHHRPPIILIFIPGNPGCIGWYTKNLVALVERLGPGFCARGVSYASHSSREALTQVEDRNGIGKSRKSENNKTCDMVRNSNPSIPWTIDGQVEHKCAFLDYVLGHHHETTSPSLVSSPRFLFLSHSIGSHMVERLCIRRPDLLLRTIGILHLMPFIRMNASKWTQQPFLDWGAANPTTVIRLARTATQGIRRVPKPALRASSSIFRIMDDAKDCELALALLRQPNYARNFFELGLEEIRDVPETIDVPALLRIGSHCPIAMLFAGSDQWAPTFLMHELQRMQQQGYIPTAKIISLDYRGDLRHDYISHAHMIPIVVDWCLASIHKILLRQDVAVHSFTSSRTNAPFESKL